MPRKASYPEWVTKHLEKAIYVNRVGDKYYLYWAHFERKNKLTGISKSSLIREMKRRRLLQS